MNHPKLGIVLYSVRKEMEKDFKGVLKELAAIGYEGVEFAHTFGGLDPDELAEYLRELNLVPYGIYEKVTNLINPDSDVYRYAAALGIRDIAFGFGPTALADDFDACIEQAAQMLTVAREKNCVLAYHAHDHEFKKRDGEYELDLILNDPRLSGIAFEADTCWIQRGGEDVVGYMNRYADRIPIVHFKDTTEGREHTELGNGIVDFKAAAAFAREKNIPWVGYEQDQSNLPGLESARRSYVYLSSILRG